MKRVYIAGALNDMSVGYIRNMHRMIVFANIVRGRGFAVYVPCVDILQGLVAGDWRYNKYFDNSYSWLQVADAVFVVPKSEKSKGTMREVEKAKSMGIPVFYKINKLVKHFK